VAICWYRSVQNKLLDSFSDPGLHGEKVATIP
jgi:hypothetical protein